MKKYLMTGIAALTLAGIFTSCSHDMDLYSGGDTTETIKENYENAFISTFGTPAANQTWGFGPSAVAGTRGMTRANAGENYPATHEYQDANGNVIAGANMNHNQWGSSDLQSMPYGGWIVPDPLTEGQKLRVQMYFQANPNLTYQDPQWRHFFVQQVYKGGNGGGGTTEKNYSASGTEYTSDHMNLLTVGQACSHINDFNNGSCTTSNVLNHEGKTQSDQITLMVNIDDTSCFGYHNTGMSLQRNDKAALVAASVIDAWAAQNGNPGEAVVDKWNRSFLGFDFELFSLEDSYVKNNGEIVYAKMTDGQNGSLKYVWDGSNVVSKGVEGVADLDLTSQFNKVWNDGESFENNSDGTITYHAAQWGGLVDDISNTIDFSIYKSLVVEFAEATPVKTQIYIEIGDEWNKWGEFKKDTDAGATQLELDFTGLYNLNKIRQVALQAADAGDLKISKIYLKGEAGEEGFGDYLLVDGKKVPFLYSNMNQYGGSLYGGKDEALSDSEMKINKDGKDCFNMEKIKELVDAGYLPVKDKNLRTWVKWAGGDGYFSDWIVTLSKGERIGSEADDEIQKIRVIAEDLNAKESKTFEGGSDFDFNDVVFDVIWNKTQNKVSIKVLADGAEYTMYIGGADEKSVDGLMTVNEMFEASNPDKKPISKRTYPNTAPGSHDDHDNLYYTPYEFDLDSTEWKGDKIGQIANSILVRVSKSGVLMTLTAPEAGAAAKVAVGTDYDWCDENQFIDAQDKYNGKFARYVKRELGDDWYKSYVK